MVSSSKFIKYLKEQEIKEKRKLEKELTEKKRKEEIYRLAKERKLERELTDALEEKKEKEKHLYRLERSRRERESRRQLRLKKKIEVLEHDTKHIGITKTTEFIFTEKEKEKCIKKTLDELTDEISGSKLVCPPGKELKKEMSPRELTADLI